MEYSFLKKYPISIVYGFVIYLVSDLVSDNSYLATFQNNRSMYNHITPLNRLYIHTIERVHSFTYCNLYEILLNYYCGNLMITTFANISFILCCITVRTAYDENVFGSGEHIHLP